MKAATPADLAEIDSFCDSLWLEDGLAKATLASYRSDLARLAGWLAGRGGEALIDVREASEWDQGHIDGAIHISKSYIEQQVSVWTNQNNN